MGKGGGSAKQQVVDYYLSMHQGICWGPVDSLEAIYIGEKEAWSGSVSTMTPITVSKPDLFGGKKKEGGVSGTAYFLPGDDDQVMPESLAAKLGLTSATCPGYRGVASIFFTGMTAAGGPPPWWGGIFGGAFATSGAGFLWGSNNPYLKTIWMKVKRSPKGLSSAYRMIGNQVSAQIDGFTVTCNGETGTLTNGVVGIVGGHSFVIDYISGDPNNGNRTVTVDGLDIEITKSDGKFTVSIGSEERTKIRPGGTASIYGMSITVGQSSTAVSFGSAGQDANPAHIIYECLTNTDWGMGASNAIINVQSFEDAGKTLYNEGLGLSLGWMSSSTIESFVTEIIDHILATVFVNPSDGLITIKLIRDDYDPDALPELNIDNCNVTAFDRKLWGETINEIVVTWTNPANETEETVTVQDLANCAIQGNIVSDSRNYHGVRNAALATKLAVRDIRSASAPLASFELEVDRSAWNFVPGGVVKLTYPEDGIDGVILRIGKIDYGKAGAPTIRVNAMEDIFGLPVASYTVPPATEWTDPSETPNAIDFVRIITAPRYFVENNLDAASVAAAQYPDVVTMIFAAQDSGDTFDFDILGEKVQADGSVIETNLGTRSMVVHANLGAPLPAAAQSTLSNLVNVIGVVPQTSDNVFVMLGSGGDADTEFALITATDEVTGATIKRGLLDTVPRSWPAGTPVWMFVSSTNVTDKTVRSAGETVEYKLLSRTSTGLLDPSEAPTESFTLTDRPWLPNRPANVQVGGQAFGTIDIGDGDSVDVTWANRNRLMEPTTVLGWTDGDVTPEAGQTTRVTVMKADRTVLTTHDGLTGTSFTLPASSFLGEATGIVRVTAVRDGLESIQGHEITVTLSARGYGKNYGRFYGGS